MRLLFTLIPLLAATAADDEVGNEACAACHTEIYRKYSASSMANSSGKAGAGEFRESFERALVRDAAGSSYAVSATSGEYRLKFSRDESGVEGLRLLGWFVGSGRVARSYVSSLDGFLYQAPVSYYSLTGTWALSPGYQQHDSIHLTRAVGKGCLQCHASRLQPVAGTANRFGSPPFLQPGVGCERCHGPGRDHLERMKRGKGPIGVVNPAKLDALRRDSVCAQCHLTGAARISRAHTQAELYRPGGRLSDYASYFVWRSPASPVTGANSHFEKLRLAACKLASGDRMWCGSCHDPHGEPSPAQRAAFYRARCEKCHSAHPCTGEADARARAQNDCISCHMPKNPVRDTEHAVFTDHTIPRRSSPRPAGPDADRTLEPFWKGAGDRDLGLAYAMVAGEDPALRRRAFDLLRRAEAADPDDAAVLTQLAQLYDRSGAEPEAIALSQRVLRLDPAEISVAVNLGTWYVRQGRAREAMRLWADALSRNPALTGVSMNLAVAQFQTHDPAAAEATLRKALEYDPDHEKARALLAEIRSQAR